MTPLNRHATAWAALFIALAAFSGLQVTGIRADVQHAAAATPPDVLVIEHTYEGTTERAGTLLQWTYSNGHAFVEFRDDGEGIFHNGFEGLTACQ